ncbi:MAG: S1 RNA-binding domain-containing protein [Butyrivibrio sp.]|uniref:CvfB family protein n=1 Tax=Butyrivibrio sp. TaxID=28121 RepID=UPI001B4C45F0|nr:S1-like domain-containing RNA-binding protein [Butyrivibrio sp.]MBP3273419.1 S1 RNA-binding domain-containing protein [Butyrivibrio sp.]MBP3782742.1 S1 RNA-binding domain-containing protein [Butyrivibrio sp.]
MIRLGEKQTLVVIKKVDFGVYLAEKAGSEEKVLLPVKQVPQGADLGSSIEVFIYKDSDDRLIATTSEPKIMLGDVRVLKVKETTRIGAFMDWGLEKDVLLPFKEQTAKVKAGDDVLCAMYIDKSSRLCVTMNVYKYLKSDSPYKKDDKVMGTVYEMSDNFGAFVAVDDIYSGLIAKKELYGNLKIGDRISARVVSVKEDGRLNLSVREKAYLQMDTDADKIFAMIEDNGGKLGFTDKASPDLIKEKTGMSKNEFKRAVGRLLKEGKIVIGETSIELK